MTAREDSLNVLLTATAEVVDDFAAEVTDLRDEVGRLRAALEARAPIEQARGMLMMRYGLTADDALRLLLRWSGTQKVELRLLALGLLSLGIAEGRMTSHPETPAAGPGPHDVQRLGSSDTTAL